MGAVDLATRLLGSWSVERYMFEGRSFATRGTILFLPHFLMSTIIYDVAQGRRRASANSGPYSVEGNDIVMIQSMQLHYDNADAAHNLLTENEPERIACAWEGERLRLTFPSSNSFLCSRSSVDL